MVRGRPLPPLVLTDEQREQLTAVAEARWPVASQAALAQRQNRASSPDATMSTATSERATIAFRPQVCLAALNIRARKRSPVLSANRCQI